MEKSAKAYPLSWPAGYPRTKSRQASKFKVTPGAAIDSLVSELEKLAGKNCLPVISSNVRVSTRTGQMYADQASDKIEDPGVAVYFQHKGTQVVLCCDKWNTAAENVRAIALTINAMRGMDRWAVSDILNRMFTGFKALPEKGTIDNIWTVLDMQPTKHKSAIHDRYRLLSMTMHPDAGGSRDEWDRLQEAYQSALKQCDHG